jgi:hypothetical protein
MPCVPEGRTALFTTALPCWLSSPPIEYKMTQLVIIFTMQVWSIDAEVTAIYINNTIQLTI